MFRFFSLRSPAFSFCIWSISFKLMPRFYHWLSWGQGSGVRVEWKLEIVESCEARKKSSFWVSKGSSEKSRLTETCAQMEIRRLKNTQKPSSMASTPFIHTLCSKATQFFSINGNILVFSIFTANGKTEKCLFTLINCRLVIVCLGEGHTVSCFQHYMYICTSFETWRAALKFSILACVIQRKGKTSDQSGRSSPCAADIAVAMLENWAPVKSCKVNISTIYNTGQCSGDMDNKGSVLLRCS